MSVAAAAVRYLKKYGRPVTIDGAPAYLEWGKPAETRVGALRIPGRRALCTGPVSTGARIDDGSDIHAVTVVTMAPDGITLEAIPMTTHADVYRMADTQNAVTGVSSSQPQAVASDVPCFLYSRSQDVQEGAALWRGTVEYHVLFFDAVVQEGDELQLTGVPKLKVGTLIRPEGQALWQVVATAVTSTGDAGTEV